MPRRVSSSKVLREPRQSVSKGCRNHTGSRSCAPTVRSVGGDSDDGARAFSRYKTRPSALSRPFHGRAAPRVLAPGASGTGNRRLHRVTRSRGKRKAGRFALPPLSVCVVIQLVTSPATSTPRKRPMTAPPTTPSTRHSAPPVLRPVIGRQLVIGFALVSLAALAMCGVLSIFLGDPEDAPPRRASGRSTPFSRRTAARATVLGSSRRPTRYSGSLVHRAVRVLVP